MDVFAAIRELREERDRLDAMIGVLQSRLDWERQRTSPASKIRRGRRNMGPEERLQVSERMRRYWDQRRGSLTS
ncbi:MAG: hypothetical protein HY822_22660 [Acidobacteria bacterium]|nr:hypothetical protein [Acidobacteriota bacterium]